MCALAKLRRKKVPNLFLGICILITAALLVNALILWNELDTVFDRAYEEMDGPHMCCLWNRERISPDTVRQYLDTEGGDISYQITEHTKTIDYMEKDGVKLSSGILLELSKPSEGGMLSPRLQEGEGAEQPGKNQIWITTKMAKILRLKVGDDFVLQLADESVRATVGKIVSDPVFGSSSTNVYRMWCGPGRLSDFPLAENDAVSYLELKFRQYTRQAEQDFIRGAEEYFQLPLADTIYTYDRIKSGYTAPYRMIAALLCFISAVLTVTVLALTLFLIKSDMDEDIRSMGIYKSLGMTGKQIAAVYLICYGAIGFAGAAPGSLLGGWLNRRILTKLLGDIGIQSVSFEGSGGYQLLAGAAVPAAVAAICLCAMVQIRKLNASHAIRTGLRRAEKGSRRKPKSTCYGGRSSFEMYYAIRGMRSKKLRYGYIAGVSLILGCLTILCLGSLNAVKHIDEDPEAWGFIKTDIYVTSLEDTPVSSIIPELEGDPKIAYTYGANKITCQYKPGPGEIWRDMVTEVYELPWKDEGKDRSLSGRRPMKEGEISVGMALAEEYGLKVGDPIQLAVKGEKKEYIITGIFQTLSNYGRIIRMVTDDLDQFMKADGGFGDYMLVLADGTDKWEFADRLAEQYGGAFSFIASKSNGENITGVLSPAVGTILAILLILAVLIAVNLTFLLIRREQRLIGLLKAVGMTSRQILKIYSWRNCLAALAGNSLGLILGASVLPELLTPYARLLGIAEFPFVNSPAADGISFILLPACMLLGTCAALRSIHTVSVKQLVSQ